MNTRELSDGMGGSYLEPGTSFGSGLLGRGKTTVTVVADGGSVRGSIGLSSRLDPDDGINERGASAGGGASTEAGVVDVAPETESIRGGD